MFGMMCLFGFDGMCGMLITLCAVFVFLVCVALLYGWYVFVFVVCFICVVSGVFGMCCRFGMFDVVCMCGMLSSLCFVFRECLA